MHPDMAQWLDQHLAGTTLRCLQRSEAGLKAGCDPVRRGEELGNV